MNTAASESSFFSFGRLRRRFLGSRAVERLEHLLVQRGFSNTHDAETTTEQWKHSGDALAALNDRVGLAGFTTRDIRSRLRIFSVLLVVVGVTTGFSFGATMSTRAAIVGSVVAGYSSILALLIWLKRLAKRQERRTLYFTPLVLEELILLVESGLGLLPSLQRVVAAGATDSDNNPVTRVLRIVYDLASHGMPFGQALNTVANSLPQNILRHVLLHLDVSARQGAELIPALRALSSHSHTEWKLSVETRVKRLENLVVFPVFTAVIGLMFLTAAVPLVPVLELRSSLQHQQISTHPDESRSMISAERRRD